MTYSQTDLLRIGKRVNNAKRSYLLVNPLQAKHIPSSPYQALGMMHTLGDRLAQRYPESKLVIGFAETATAIGAAAASRLGEDCLYLTTTREDIPEVKNWVLFSEEHSHAVDQKLCGDNLAERLTETESIIFIDDEISTGKTLINMMEQLRSLYPSLAGKKLVAASLISRVSPEHERRLAEAGLTWEYLVKLEGCDPADVVADLQAEEARPVLGAGLPYSHGTLGCPPLPDPRRGMPIRRYLEGCQQMTQAFLSYAALDGVRRAVVLGTEECMYPALVLGKALEERGLSVGCHATTRSPIGICPQPGYPIASGNRLASFYQEGRDTYIYNISPCDALILVSDAPSFRPEALDQLAAAWAPWGYQKLFFIQGGQNVWYI